MSLSAKSEASVSRVNSAHSVARDQREPRGPGHLLLLGPSCGDPEAEEPGGHGGPQSSLSEWADSTGTAREINRTLKCKGDH